MKEYIDVTPEEGKRFYQNYKDKGEIVMLNLLKFREIADYTNIEHLKPLKEISGKEAYDLYMKLTYPFLEKVESKLLFKGNSKNFVIGPSNEEWDYVLLVAHKSVEAFMSFATNEDYLKISDHRKAALKNSRLLPISKENSMLGND